MKRAHQQRKKATEVSKTASGVEGACCKAHDLSTIYMVERENQFKLSSDLQTSEDTHIHSLIHTLTYKHKHTHTHTHIHTLTHTINIEKKTTTTKGFFLWPLWVVKGHRPLGYPSVASITRTMKSLPQGAAYAPYPSIIHFLITRQHQRPSQCRPPSVQAFLCPHMYSASSLPLSTHWGVNFCTVKGNSEMRAKFCFPALGYVESLSRWS